MAEDAFRAEVLAATAQSGFRELSSETSAKLEAFACEVALWSERMHLVGRGTPKKNLGLLMLDSLLLLKNAQESGLLRSEETGGSGSALAVADIGSGAGFPGLVWKIVRPDLVVTLFERKERTHAFLERVIAALGLSGVQAVSEDAAHYAGGGRFSIVTSKAAGRLLLLLPLAERLLVPGGIYLTIKGSTWRKELEGSSQGAMRLVSAAELPEGRGVALSFRRTTQE